MQHDARAEIDKGSELAQNNLRSKAIWAIASALGGELVEARKVLDELLQELEPPDYSSAYHCAALHALFGETDEAFACLEMARQGRAVQLAYIAIAPELESLHNDPRFRELLLGIGIPASRT